MRVSNGAASTVNYLKDSLKVASCKIIQIMVRFKEQIINLKKAYSNLMGKSQINSIKAGNEPEWNTGTTLI